MEQTQIEAEREADEFFASRPFRSRKLQTTPIKQPTQSELYIMQLGLLLEEMLVKEICKCER